MRKIPVHVRIEAPNGERDFRRCSCLDEVKNVAEEWQTGTAFTIEMIGMDIVLEVTKHKSGALVP